MVSDRVCPTCGGGLLGDDDKCERCPAPPLPTFVRPEDHAAVVRELAGVRESLRQEIKLRQATESIVARFRNPPDAMVEACVTLFFRQYPDYRNAMRAVLRTAAEWQHADQQVAS